MVWKQLRFPTSGQLPFEVAQFHKLLGNERVPDINGKATLLPLGQIAAREYDRAPLVTLFLLSAFTLFKLMRIKKLHIQASPSYQFTYQKDIILNIILEKCTDAAVNSNPNSSLIVQMQDLLSVVHTETHALKMLTQDNLYDSPQGCSPLVKSDETCILMPCFELVNLLVDPTISSKKHFFFIRICHLEILREAICELPHKLQQSVFTWANPVLTKFPFYTVYSTIFFGKKTSHKKIPLIKEFFFSIEHLVPKFLPLCYHKVPPHVLVIFLFSKDVVTQEHLYDFIGNFGPLTLTTAQAYVSRILSIQKAVQKCFPNIKPLWKPYKTDSIMLRFENIHPNTTDSIPLVAYFRFLTFTFQHSEEAAFVGLLFHAAMLATARMNEFLSLLHKDISLKRAWDTQTESYYFEFVLRYQRSKTRRLGYGAEVRFPDHPLPCLSFKNTYLKLVSFNRLREQMLEDTSVGGHVSPSRFYRLLKKYWTLFYTTSFSDPAQHRAYASIRVGPHSARKTGCRFYHRLGLTAPMVKLTSLHSKYSVVLQDTYFQPSLTELHSEVLDQFRNLW